MVKTLPATQLIHIMSELISNEFVTFETIKGTNIILGTLAPGLIVTLDIAKKIEETRLKIWGNAHLPLVMDVSLFSNIDDDARDYWATPKSMRLIKAVAIITKKKHQALIANFFILFSKPVVPTRLFHNKIEAVNWCKKFS